MLLTTGRQIDRYEVEALLGEGGMAEVYRVRHRTLGSQHALKVLKLEIPGLKERLVQEGQLQATLRHPNVVAVTDVVDIEGRPGLVMEHIAGPTLELWLRNHQPTLEEAEELFLGVLAGVARAHRIGLVHRDLKPGNVLLEETDDGFIPKVTDFGLAKVLVEQGGSYRTRSGVPMGTPAYMAPEQVRDAANVDQRADIFALGAILYELVAGVPPFDAPDALTIFSRLARGEYIPPEALVPTLPERFRRAIRGALQIEREDRIPDCGALRALFVGGQELSEASVAHVVPLRGAGPRSTVVNTLEPAGHARTSGSDTFVADGVASVSTSPTMTPESLDGPPPPSASAPGASAPSASPPSASRPSAPERDDDPASRGARTWLFGLGALGAVGLVGTALVAAALLGVWLRPAPVPTPPDLRPRPPDTVIPEVPVPTPSTRAPEPGVAVAAPPAAPAVAPPAPPPSTPTPTPAAPKVPTPKVVAPPVEEPEPPTGPLGLGTLTVTGDADEVWLERGGARQPPGPLPAGDYQLRARFGTETLSSGTVRLREGETTRVNCSAAFKLCRTR